MSKNYPAIKGVPSSSSGGDMTDAEVKAAYERNPDTNAFEDADEAKLDSIVDYTIGAGLEVENDTLSVDVDDLTIEATEQTFDPPGIYSPCGGDVVQVDDTITVQPGGKWFQLEDPVHTDFWEVGRQVVFQYNYVVPSGSNNRVCISSYNYKENSQPCGDLYAVQPASRLVFNFSSTSIYLYGFGQTSGGQGIGGFSSGDLVVITIDAAGQLTLDVGGTRRYTGAVPEDAYTIAYCQAAQVATLENTSIVTTSDASLRISQAVQDAIAANTAKETNATHTGEVTGSGALTIAAGAVTTPKLSAALAAEIAANTAKETNATHTGDVTGSSVLTIADLAVSKGKLSQAVQDEIDANTAKETNIPADDATLEDVGANPTPAGLTTTQVEVSWDDPALTITQVNYGSYADDAVGSVMNTAADGSWHIVDIYMQDTGVNTPAGDYYFTVARNSWTDLFIDGDARITATYVDTVETAIGTEYIFKFVLPSPQDVDWIRCKTNTGASHIRFWDSDPRTTTTIQIKDGGVTTDKVAVQDKLDLNTAGMQEYLAGRLSYDEIHKCLLGDMGFAGVRCSFGLELYIPFFNDTGVEIADGKIINAAGAEDTVHKLKGILADNSSPATSSSIIGISTHAVPTGSWGLATSHGEVHGMVTTGLTEGGIAYVGTAGNTTNTRPQYPANISIIGSCVEAHASEGIMQVDRARFVRNQASKSYSFTSNGVGAGTYYVGGFYNFETSSTEFTALPAGVSMGSGAMAAHAGIVAKGGATVDTGQVGLRAYAVNLLGAMDDEEGTQTTDVSGIITDDITTLSADTYYETSEKFSGLVRFELYIVSGSPVNISFEFNYGFAKYEDIGNQDFTLLNFEAVWEGGANDSNSNIELLHHKDTGWTFAATGFEPGNGTICEKAVDQAIVGDVNNGENGSYKRVSLNQFIDGNGSEGILVRITTGTNNTFQSMDLHLRGVSEELT